MTRLSCSALAAVLTAVFVFPASASASGEDAARGEQPSVKVMTRNIYVGADIFRVLEVDPALALTEIAAVYQTVIETNFAERAESLADEVLAENPDLIGLQEVSLIRRQSPGDIFTGDPPVPATDVELDYLQLFLDALAARGLNYTVAASVDNADVELPLLLGAQLDDIRLTDRDVILARSDVAISNVATGNYASFVAVELSGLEIAFLRGYNAVDAEVPGLPGPIRFVNTHLEVGGGFGAATQAEQVAELVGILAEETLPLVLLGDFNASPEDPPEQAYGQLVASGFNDVWQVFGGADPGYTCCHEETLMNEFPELDSRIDIVFVRNPAAPQLEGGSAVVLGGTPGDQTPSGLWPSDHAGVSASLALGLASDQDFDGVADSGDNCRLIANADQRDTDGDGFGNRCDADFNQDLVVNFADLAVMRQRIFSNDPDADLDGDGSVSLSDVGILKSLFYQPPGPGAAAP